MRRVSFSSRGRIKLAAAFLLAAAGGGACNDVTGPTTGADPFQVTAEAGDVTPPTVAILAPPNGATGVPTNVRVILQFSEKMNVGTINSSTFFVTPAGGPPVAGAIVFHGSNKVSFDVTSAFAAGTTFTVNVTTGARDFEGNGLATPFASTFSTAPLVDNTAPTVVAATPVNGAGGVPVNTSVTATFSEAMDAATIGDASVSLAPTAGGPQVPATVSYNAGTKVATIAPTSALSFSTAYTMTVSTAVKDVAGNSMASAFTSAFTTAAAPDVTPPTITTVSPVDAATSVAIGTNVVVTFSELMNSGTVNSSTVTLTPTAGGPAVAAVVTYNSGAGTATLNPTADLANSTSYTVNVTAGATDPAGNPLTPFASTFSTAAVVDNTAPTVVGTSPVNGATGVAVNTSVTATFSEAMDAATIGGASVSLAPTAGGPQVPATVSYDAGTKVATIAPSSALSYSTSYTMSVSTAVKDVAGNAMASVFTAAFTTAAAPDVTAPTITNVSPVNAGTNVAIGANVVVTFSEPMNSSTVNTSTVTLTPTAGGPAVAAVVTYNSGAGTATLNPTGNLANSTSYTVNVTAAATDLAGNPLSPFTSSFTTVVPGDGIPPTAAMLAPLNGATGVATNIKIVLQFNEKMNVGTINSSTLLVAPSGGSPVPGVIGFHGSNKVSFDVTAPMTGGTVYTVTLTSGVTDLSGTPLSPQFTASFTTVGTDVSPPTVTNVSPLNAATNVAVASNVVVTFSEAMTAGTVNTSTFTLTPTAGGSPVTAVVNYSAGSATLNPSGDLAFSTSYTVNVTSGAKDLANNGLTPFSSTFTTAAAPDLTPPTVTNVTPVNAATGVAVNSDVVVTFSEAMTGATVNTSTFTLTPTAGGSPITAVVNYSAGSATLNPSSDLGFSTSYTVNVTSGAKDLANNGLTPFSSTFTTAAAPDLTPPTVTNVTPVNAATGVAVNSDVVVTFSEAMTGATVTTSTFTLTPTAGGSPITAVVNYSAGSATLNPSSDLGFSTSYTVNVTSGAKDLANNGLTPFSSTFTTAAAPDLTPPTVTNVTPVNAATGVAVNSDVVVTFSETMTGATVNTSTFTLTPTAGGSPITAVVNYSAGSATLNPSGDLAFSTSYTVSVTSGAKDLANNGLTPFSSTFTTAAAPDLTPPTVTNVSPVNAATNVGIASNVVVTFSEAMSAATVTTSTFTLTPTSGGSPVTAVVNYSAGSATLNPSSDLAYSTSYTVNVTNGAKDLANNGLTPFSSTFTTVAAPDLTPPTVTNVTPVNSATNVAIATNVVVNFSETMSAATVNTTTFTLTPTSGGSPVTAVVTYSAGSATLNPSGNLLYNTSYTVNVTSGAKDLANNGLTPFSSSFTTLPPDVTAPTITSVSPVNRSWDNSATAQVRVTFNEPIDVATMNATTFRVQEVLPTGAFIGGTRTYDAGTNTIVFTPSAAYKNHLSYRVLVSTGLKDVSGNALGTDFLACFTPTAGTGVAMSMNGTWAGNNACDEVHWHLRMLQTGNDLSLVACTSGAIECESSAVTQAGVDILGPGCTPSPFGPPRICDLTVVSLTGTVSGSSVTFTMFFENGLSFTFTGSRSQTGTSNPFFTGYMTGATLTPIGVNFQREIP